MKLKDGHINFRQHCCYNGNAAIDMGGYCKVYSIYSLVFYWAMDLTTYYMSDDAL